MATRASDPEESNSNPPPRRKAGRPKGSKDGPRPPYAPKRGRPAIERSTKSGDGSNKERDSDSVVPASRGSSEFSFESLDENVYNELHLYEIEQGLLGRTAHVDEQTDHGLTTSDPLKKELSHEELRDASEFSKRRPFFTSQTTFSDGEESDNDFDDDFMEPESGISHEELSRSERPGNTPAADGRQAWFKQPKHMPYWLFQFFVEKVGPLIFTRKGKHLSRPESFSNRPGVSGSLWLHPPAPIISLSSYTFSPELLYRPRIFLWLPHFFVETLRCPTCHRALEKNGACPPRGIVDVSDTFWIVTWAYYCRTGCQSHFRGWSPAILASLPQYLSLEFPAVLSRKSGLSISVVNQLRVGNQHKMGPSGIRSLLFEEHTRKFNTIHLQYLEAIYEAVRGRQEAEDQSQTTQSTLDSYVTQKYASFGDFSDPEKYAGFVPSEFFLAQMMNRVIEKNEPDANQHTSCISPDQISIDDSHKVNKHIAKIDGVPVFNALWTCMDSRYIRGQTLTLTKAHEERNGPLKGISESIKRYGYSPPQIAFSDDPLKDKGLLHDNFPTLAEKLTPMSAAHGYSNLALPDSVSVTFLGSATLVNSALLTILAPLEDNSAANICISLDAEWNISRTEGVSIVQITSHSNSDLIFVIPVHRFKTLPTALSRLLTSKRVFKIGSNIKGDITRLRKQFPAISDQVQTNLIDLKDFCIARGLITRKEPGSLEILCRKLLNSYLEKPDFLRRHDDWETGDLTPALLNYAALDVYSSRLIFEKASEHSPFQRPSSASPAGTAVTLLLQDGGNPIAHGRIAANQPSKLGPIRVKTPSKNRLVIDIDVILNPTAAIMLHIPLDANNSRRKSSTKSGALTLGELQNLAPSGSVPFQIVTPVSSLIFYQSDSLSVAPEASEMTHSSISSLLNHSTGQVRSVAPLAPESSINSTMRDQDRDSESDGDADSAIPDTLLDLEMQHGTQDDEDDEVALSMLEARSSVLSDTQEGPDSLQDNSLSPESQAFVKKLQDIVNSPPDDDNQYTRVKKDLFHAFHMIPTPVNHGLRPTYLRALRDHIMRWDPEIRQAVDEICQKVFHLTFDQMLIRNPQYIKKRTPRYVPPPSILVPAISHVFDTFGNAVDAKTGAPLFNKTAWQKAQAVLDLAREGYLSDNKDVVLYEKAGIDKHGLQKWKCLRGTNNVEGGPHGDIYRKFGALHAGPRLTVNCLTDHRTWYNLQAYAAHLYGVDWQYHHDLALINRTSFLLNYLSDVVHGAQSYDDWVNGDLYERTTEQFGICKFPDSLRLKLAMDTFNENSPAISNASDDWLRCRQGLALPVIPPTTPEARRFFFTEIAKYAAAASTESKKQINFVAFARDWNQSADGKSRFYITPEVLIAYAKTWEKNSNIKASADLIADALDVISQTSRVFAAADNPFPGYLTAPPVSDQPREGLLEDVTTESSTLPASLSISLAVSRPSINTPSVPRPSSSQPLLIDMFNRIPEPSLNIEADSEYVHITTPQSLAPSTPTDSVDVSTPPAKRRRIVPANERKRNSIRRCRRCLRPECPGNSNIMNCPIECTRPCIKCGQTTGCRGVDNGKNCTYAAE